MRWHSLVSHPSTHPQLKEECKAIRDKMMFEVQRGGQQKATTDQFQSVWDDLLSVSVVKHLLYRCGKCKKRETTFYVRGVCMCACMLLSLSTRPQQLQTRSADEVWVSKTLFLFDNDMHPS